VYILKMYYHLRLNYLVCRLGVQSRGEKYVRAPHLHSCGKRSAVGDNLPQSKNRCVTMWTYGYRLFLPGFATIPGSIDFDSSFIRIYNTNAYKKSASTRVFFLPSPRGHIFFIACERCMREPAVLFVMQYECH
jgi:hypothetical protein